MPHVKVKTRPMARDKPGALRAEDGKIELTRSNSFFWLTDAAGFDSLKCQGYTSLADSPEVSTAVNTIARLIGAMTIHLMRNTERGDVRVQNALSDVVDIEPNRYMTRANLVQWIVRTLFLQGRGNAVVYPRTEGGALRELIPIPSAYVSLIPTGLWDYVIAINGREYRPENLLHFALNPDSYFPWRGTGYNIALSDVANNLKQAAATEKGFMSSKWKPSIIVKVDAFDEAFKDPAGRQKLLDSYVKSASVGEPWLLPGEQFDVKEIRPLSLADLALADFVKLDKQTVATILGVPPFVLGVGPFRRDEWNNFVSTTIMPIAQLIEQEMTRKLLMQRDLFFRFNARSLHNYSMDELVKAGAEMVDRMAMRRNEWRDWMGLEPDPEMDKLLALENYIPADRLGDQSKLTGGESK